MEKMLAGAFHLFQKENCLSDVCFPVERMILCKETEQLSLESSRQPRKDVGRLPQEKCNESIITNVHGIYKCRPSAIRIMN
jgi:hypothetical protein